MRRLLGLNHWIVDAALVLLAAALAYLPLVGQLGYTHDDWFTIAAKVSGVGLQAMHAVDRPLLGRLYAWFYAVLGDAPLGWHLMGFALRSAGALIFLWLAKLLWQRQRSATLAMALLFAVYPGFLRQPGANNYLNHFTAFGAGVLSLALSVCAARSRQTGRQLLLVGLSALLSWFYPRVFEALIGLEALRLALLAYLFASEPFWKRLRRVLLWAAPNLAALGVVLYWRLFVFQSGRSSVDAGALLGQYTGEPLQMLLRIFTETGKDFFETVLLAWFVPLYQRAAASYADLGAALLIVLAALTVLWFVRLGQPGAQARESENWAREAVVLGALGVLFALLPVAILDRDVQFSYNLDRYTLPAIPGAAMLIVGLGALALRQRWQKPALGLLLALALLTHFLNAAQARDEWALQKQLWWQFTWRVPGLRPETALVISLPEGYRLAEDFEIWAPANLIYAYPPAAMPVITAEVLTAQTAPQVAGSQQVWRGYRQIGFTKKFNFALVASMPTRAACLHVLDGRAPEFSSSEDALVRVAGLNSQIDQIVVDAAGKSPPRVIFGSEPPRGWCYYYQKASLARQLRDWNTAASLGDAARSRGLSPADVVEWLPFYQAYRVLGRETAAQEIAAILREDEDLLFQLCASGALEGDICAEEQP